MPSRRAVLALVLAVGMGVVAPAAWPARRADALPISDYILGLVTQAENGQPIGGACITASYNDGRFRYSTQTTSAADGRYRLAVPDGSGRYDLVFDSNCGAGGYWARMSRTVSADALSGRVFVTNVDQALPRGGRIVGRVTDSQTGAPISGLGLGAESGYYYQGAQSDSSGYFVVGSLPPNPYTLEYYGASPRYLGNYYDHKYTLATATPIDVVAGQDNVADQTIDPGATITGTVTDAVTGQPLSGVEVIASDPNNARGSGSLVFTDSAGHYSFDDLYLLSAGTWTVEFTGGPPGYVTQYWDHTTDAASATPITLNYGQTVTGIDAALTR